MRYALCYDIARHRARERVAQLLSGYGSRVQESVFECELSKADLAKLTAELQEALTGEPEANVRCYRLCADCREASFGLGELRQPADAKGWIVV